MLRFFRTIAAVCLLTIYFMLGPFGYIAFALLQLIPVRDSRARTALLQGVLHRAFGFMHATLRWFSIVDFDPRDLEGELPDGPCVIVANHPTLMDYSAITACFRNLSTAVKQPIYRSFWANPLLRQAGYFEAPGRNPFTVNQVVDAAVDRLAQGYRVLIFPEGTRSPRDDLHQFGRTAFEIAKRANVPIVPILITCTPRWLSKGDSVVRLPRDTPRLRLRALPSVDPSKTAGGSRGLRDVLERLIRQELAASAASAPQPSVSSYVGIIRE